MKKLLLFGLVAFLLIGLSSMAFADFTTDNQAWVSLQDGNKSSFDVYGATGTAGILNGAYDFDGVDDRVITSTPLIGTLDSDWSFSLWFNSDTAGVFQSIFSEGGAGANPTIALRKTNTNVLDVVIRDDSGDLNTATGTTPIVLGTNYSVIVTYESTTDTVRLYLNNVLEASATNVNWNTVTMTLNAIGVNYQGGSYSNYFDGSIDELKIFDKNLNRKKRII